MADEFGDFEEVREEGQEQQSQEGPSRVRMPRGRELMGIVVQRLGGNRMEVKSTDGKTRNCRVPGRFKRRFWLRPGNAVLIIPWEYDDSKGDVVFQYSKGASAQLKKKGMLNFAQEGF